MILEDCRSLSEMQKRLLVLEEQRESQQWVSKPAENPGCFEAVCVGWTLFSLGTNALMCDARACGRSWTKLILGWCEEIVISKPWFPQGKHCIFFFSWRSNPPTVLNADRTCEAVSVRRRNCNNNSPCIQSATRLPGLTLTCLCFKTFVTTRSNPLLEWTPAKHISFTGKRDVRQPWKRAAAKKPP